MAAAYALPASPDCMKIKQADGTYLTVRMIGDERFHYALTPDGFPLIEKDGVYHYAQLAADGIVEATTLKASDIDKRSQAERAFLQSTDASALMDKLNTMETEQTKIYNSYIYNKVCAARLNSPNSMRFGDFVAEGSPKTLVVLVEFDDVKFCQADPAAYFRRMLSEEGFSDNGATGSVLDYFKVNSSGKYTPDFEIVGPVKLDKPLSYYGANDLIGVKDKNAPELVSDLCTLIDPEVDFTRYDNNKNGVIDGLYIIYAGEGEATGGPSLSIWPHCSFFSLLHPDTPYLYDGVQLDTYAISHEWENGKPAAAGVFIHEYCHLLGLPDIYTGDKSILTPGHWSVLDMGPYNNERRTPPLYSAFERYALGWVEPRVLSGRENVKLLPLAENDVCIVPVNEQECYLFENRQQTGWDAYIPGHGMLVWHLDYNKENFLNVNGDGEHQRVDLVEADDKRDEATRAGDAFPGTAGVTEFGDDTKPSMRSWDGMPQNVMLTEIAETDGVITFRVNGGLKEIATPQKPAVNSLTPYGFTLSWEPVADAVDYKVTIQRADGNGEPAGALTGGATAFDAEGLEESTDYLCGVQSIGPDGFVSEMSELTAVTTPEMSFVFTRPEGLEATAEEGHGFTLSWSPLAEADAYEVTVWGVRQGDAFRLAEGFDEGASLPEGWEQSGCVAMANDSYAGVSKPALKMAPGSWLQTSAMADDVKGLSLWMRGISPKQGAQIEVEALCDGEWKAWESIAADSGEGRTMTLSNAPVGSRAIRLTFRSDGGSVVIDDLMVLWGAEEILEADPAFNPASVENENLTVTPTGTYERYLCSVTGVSGNRRSLPSEQIAVTLPVAVRGIHADGAALQVQGRTLTLNCETTPCIFEVSDIAGRVLLTRKLQPSETAAFTVSYPGIYIVRCGDKTFKTIVK